MSMDDIIFSEIGKLDDKKAKYNFNDFINIICIKRQLNNVESDILVKVYNDYQSIVLFISTILKMQELDYYFPLLDKNYISKIEKINNSIRYIGENKKLTTYINEIIRYTNSLRNFSKKERDEIVGEYWTEQEKIRGTNFETLESLKKSIAYDAFVYDEVLNNKLENIQEIDDFLISMHYFTKIIPCVYKDDSFRNNVLTKLNEIEKKSSPFPSKRKKYIKNINRTIAQINDK